MRGEDYCFTFTGKLRDGKLHFRLHMQVGPSSLPCLLLGCAWMCGKCVVAALGSLFACCCLAECQMCFLQPHPLLVPHPAHS